MCSRISDYFRSKGGEGEADAGFTKHLLVLWGYTNMRASAPSSDMAMASTIPHSDRCRRAPSLGLKVGNFSYGFGQELITSFM